METEVATAMLLNVYDYDKRLENALGAAQDGDRIYLPSDTYTAPPGGWAISKSLEIFGDGPGGDASGTTLRAASTSDDVIVIKPPVGGSAVGPVYIHDLKIRQPDGTRCGRNAIACRDGGVPLSLEALRIERVFVYNVAASAYSLDPTTGTIKSMSMVLSIGSAGQDIATQVGFGVAARNVYLARLLLCDAYGTLGDALFQLSGVALHMFLTNIGAAYGTQGQLLFDQCPVAHVEGCNLEGYYAANGHIACELRGCHGAAAFVANFLNTIPGGVGLKVSPSTDSQPAGSMTVLGNWFGPSSYPKPAPPPPTATYPLIDVDSGAIGVAALSQGQTNDGTGFITLPGQAGGANNGTWGVPYIRRGPAPISDTVAGLLIPVRNGNPSAPIQNGMMLYNLSQDVVSIRINGVWKYIVTS